MDYSSTFAAHILCKAGHFLARVLVGFRANQGLLLSGAVAYYTLLSIVPLFTVLLVALSHIVDEQRLLAIVADHLELLVPGHAHTVVEQVATFLAHREVVGWVGLGVLVFFSSMAFTVLENAMSVIFHHRVAIRRRHFLVSAVLPYLYILLLGLGLLLMTMISGALQSLEMEETIVFGWTWRLSGLTSTLLYLLGVIGVILMLTAIYMVMPVGQLSLRHALIGGVTAGILWEMVRHILVWYFFSLSLINVIYGSLATTILVLLSLEVAGMILLLGAQVIAEYERMTEGQECRDPAEGLRTR